MTPFTAKEQKCEVHFRQTFSRNDDGRLFIVQLPFKDGAIPDLEIKSQYGVKKIFIARKEIGQATVIETALLQPH